MQAGTADAPDLDLAPSLLDRVTDHSARLAPTTVAANASLWSKHVEPVFGKHRPRDMKTSEVRAWIANLQRAGHSASTIRHC
jgi:hypothetical protein